MTTAQKKAIARKLEPLLSAGQRCSNICHNLKQRDAIDKHDRASMYDSQTDWDNAVGELPRWMRKTK